MSYVDAIKEKHHFEQSLSDLFRYLNVMAIEELELAMAHIADDVVAESNEVRRINGLVKGAALRVYVELRATGQIGQRKLQRMIFRGEMKKYFERIGTAKREADIEEWDVHAQKLRDNRDIVMREYRKAHSEWARARKALPFFKRLFYDVPEPRVPPSVPEVPYPLDLTVYVKRAQKLGTMEEFFISVSRHFELLSLPDAPMEFSPQEIALITK